jgi:hypothetical protein
MANERIPNDPYDPPRSGLSDDYYGRPQRFDDGLSADSGFEESRLSSGKVTLFAVAIALVLGVVFYSLNNTSVKEAQTTPPSQTAQTQNTMPPTAPPGMRDVTPRANNSQPGMTTGSAPAAPNANK